MASRLFDRRPHHPRPYLFLRRLRRPAILPPSVGMFDQLVNWLSRQTPPDPGRFSTSMIGIGATALCLRWGTYLAVLLDEHKPLDPRIGSVEISMISDSEMKRINLEFSANLARLIRMLHEDEAGCYRLLHLAHQHLAMTRLRPRQCAELLHAFHGLTSADFWNLAGSELKSRMEKPLPLWFSIPTGFWQTAWRLRLGATGPSKTCIAAAYWGSVRSSRWTLFYVPAERR